MTILAIDPGKNGGLAFKRGSEVHSRNMPETTGDVIDYLRNLAAISPEGVECWMESMVKFIGGRTQTGASSIVYGHNYGVLEGAVMALSMRLNFVRPQKWQKALGFGRKGKKPDRTWKNELKAEAQRLFPSQTVTLGSADALLILEYATKLNHV